MSKLLVGYPTYSLTKKIKKIGAISTSENNEDVTASSILATFPSFAVEQDINGADCLCTEMISGQPVSIVDEDDVTHDPKPWILVPSTGCPDEYIGGHPTTVPKPPTK